MKIAKAPKYIQRSIKRLLWHYEVVKNNRNTIDNWLESNNINRSIPLSKFIDKNELSKEKIVPGQISIFD
jgi:hypothetical protein